MQLRLDDYDSGKKAIGLTCVCFQLYHHDFLDGARCMVTATEGSYGLCDYDLTSTLGGYGLCVIGPCHCSCRSSGVR